MRTPGRYNAAALSCALLHDMREGVTSERRALGKGVSESVLGRGSYGRYNEGVF